MALVHEKSLRGRTRTGWLDSHHTFSFGNFHDPKRMGHHALRVLNDDVVIPGAGFGEHGHENMDILTYVISGALKHQDSMGNTSVIRVGEFQHMYAGTGVVHSEMNALMQAAEQGISTRNTTLFVNGTPCYDCLKAMVNAGIVRVVHNKSYDNQADKLILKAIKKLPIILEYYERHKKTI